MDRRSSSRRWIKRQNGDSYVKDRHKRGFRSRAAFKLQEIDRRDRLIGVGMKVIDLGASPGGWTQVAAGIVGLSGTVVAVDVLSMKPVAGTVIIEGNCHDADVMEAVRAALHGGGADLVMSDLAPNITGVAAVDEAAQIELCEATLGFVREFLQPGGSLLIKLFQFSETDAMVDEVSRQFRDIWRRKPPASRSQSREFYVVAKRYGI